MTDIENRDPLSYPTPTPASDPSSVLKQYADADNLNCRASLHEKYSVNRQGFMPWIRDHYLFKPGDDILELGCGTGAIWKDRPDALPEGCSLLLTDFSRGMLDAARDTLGERPGVLYQVVDIQAIPYPDAAFDAVIANMMLYHVPDLNRALSEVRRVLRPGGAFYCATYGERGILHYLSEALAAFGVADTLNRSFTRQNGGALLKRYFREARWEAYVDALEVTDVEDVADYLYSLAGLSSLDPALRPAIVEALRARMVHGVLRIPKEYGMFICR